ncbi:MAG: hypothetical protein ACAI38_10175 [Myxococcota bacterium]|nr:hypothetical protein [Myxococcota bacterium]
MTIEQTQGFVQVASIESALQDTMNAASEAFKTRDMPRILSTPVQPAEAEKARRQIRKPTSPRQG